MKQCINLSYPTCGFRFWPDTIIKRSLQPIDYPAQIVGSAGRARGFRVIQYVPWSQLTTFKDDAQIWRALNCEYIRLGAAFDNFYTYLGFLSPGMREMIESLNAEVFRLRSKCRELQDRLDQLLLTYPRRSESIGEFGRILEEVSRRDEEDRRSARDLIK